jgi:hypothetical protein
MSSERIHELVGELLKELDRHVEEIVDGRIGLLREQLLARSGSPAVPHIGEVGDALDVARLLGLDLSTEPARKSARNRVYYLASIGSIPSIRLSKKRIQFDLDKVKQIIADAAAGNL